jgi:hypothetical protein
MLKKVSSTPDGAGLLPPEPGQIRVLGNKNGHAKLKEDIFHKNTGFDSIFWCGILLKIFIIVCTLEIS